MPRLSLPFDQWPALDQSLWQQALKCDDLDMGETLLSKWAPYHLNAAERHYGEWLKFISQQEADALNFSPAKRMSPRLLANYLKHLRTRVAPISLERYLCDLYGIIRSIADDQDWRWIGRLIQKVSAEAKRHPRKRPQFVHASELVEVGKMLIASAYCSHGEIIKPTAFRDGLIILLLIMMPVRITQFSRLEEGKHFLWGQDNRWVAHWDAAETKSRRGDDYPVSLELVEVLKVYLEKVRPMLRSGRKAATDAAETLWVGDSGVSVGSQTLRKIIKMRTAEYLGRPINPHSFRHSAATTYAIEMPERATEAAALLSHANFSTTEKYYLLGRRAKAIEIAHAALNALK